MNISDKATRNIAWVVMIGLFILFSWGSHVIEDSLYERKLEKSCTEQGMYMTDNYLLVCTAK